MNLAQLVYCSQPSSGVSSSDIEEILAVARGFNERRDITGYLVFRNDVFVQVLEGEREKVSQLYHKIARDRRHQDLVLLGVWDIESRRFSDWSMGFFALKESNLEIVRKYCPSKVLDPSEISGRAMVDLVHELASSSSFRGHEVPV